MRVGRRHHRPSRLGWKDERPTWGLILYLHVVWGELGEGVGGGFFEAG